MSWLRHIVAEIYGLFVDDVSFALSILLWLLLVAAVVTYTHVSSLVSAVLFAGGLCAILIESVTRFARVARDRGK